MLDLDSIQTLRAVDPDDMLGRIAELPDQLRAAWSGVANFPLPASHVDVDNVVVMGLGGSAIGGDLVRTLVAGEIRVPFEVARDYGPPAYVGPRTLAIASSYSGNTEETLSAYEQARAQGARLVVVSTNGKLMECAHEHGVPALPIKYKAQPRAALGHSLVPLLGILQAAHLISDQSEQVEEAARVLERLRGEIDEQVPESRNLAKRMARDLHGRLPVIYGGGLTAEVARRWKGQFNENSKTCAAFDVLPELNHNAVVGYEFPANLPDLVRVIFLASDYAHPRVKARYRITQEILRQRGIGYHEVKAEGAGALAQMMSSIYVGDYTSYYLAALNGADPSPVKVIDFLKAELAKV